VQANFLPASSINQFGSELLDILFVDSEYEVGIGRQDAMVDRQPQRHRQPLKFGSIPMLIKRAVSTSVPKVCATDEMAVEMRW